MTEELQFDITVYGPQSVIGSIKRNLERDDYAPEYERTYEVDEEERDPFSRNLLISNMKYRDLVHVVGKITTASYHNVRLPFQEALDACVNMEPDPVLRGFLMAYFINEKEVELAKKYCRPDSDGTIELGSLQQWIHDNPEHMLHSTIHGSGG